MNLINMLLRLFLIICFNLIDTISTLYVIQHGGIELNPLVAWMLQWPLVFILVKNVVAILFTAVCWKLSSYRVAHIFSWIMFVHYGLIALYYILMFTLLW